MSLKKTAYKFGVDAFKKGKPRIPAADKLFLDVCIAGLQVGEGLPYIKAWLRGYDESLLHS